MTSTSPVGAQRPKFGVSLPVDAVAGSPVSADDIYRFAERAEELGFDGLWTFEHLFSAPPSYRHARLDPMLSLAAVAARTKKVDIGTCLLLLPLRNPVHVAKDVATLDNLASGRFIFGVGTGWSAKEFEVSQVPLNDRGPRMAEYMRIIRLLLTQENVSYDGRFFKFSDITIDPRPVQSGGPAMLYGGGTLDPDLHPPDYPISTGGWNLERVFKRIARLSDGIITGYRSFPVTSAQRAEDDWGKIASYAKEFGRDASAFHRVHLTHFFIAPEGDPGIDQARRAVESFTHSPFDYVRRAYVIGTPEQAAETLRTWIRTSGIRYFVLNPIADYIPQIETLAKEVLPLVSAP